MTKKQAARLDALSFGLRHSFDIRHPDFVIS
jgi:hypothetical protein